MFRMTVAPNRCGGAIGNVNTAWGDQWLAMPAGRSKKKMRVISKNLRVPRQLLQRVDRIAADLNVILLVFAVGLATLDFTFLVTQKVIDRLPPMTRLVQDQSPATSSPAPEAQK
jgi:hypothetical protein